MRPLLYLVVSVLMLCVCCTRRDNAMPRSRQPQDTLYTSQAAMAIYDRQPHRALMIIDSAQARGNVPDHIADLLYCNNIVFKALSVVMKFPAEKRAGVDMAKAKKLYDGLHAFLMKTQIASEDPLFDGAWMRAYDMDTDEYYGLDKDKGWGAYCIETGWMTGYIPIVFMYEDEPGSYFFR